MDALKTLVKVYTEPNDSSENPMNQDSADNAGDKIASKIGEATSESNQSSTTSGGFSHDDGNSIRATDTSGGPQHNQEEITSNVGASQTTGGAINQSEGGVTQTTEHVGEIVNKTHHSHTTEEVERETTIDRNQTQVNIIEQPLKDEEHVTDQVYHENVVPTTEIEENQATAGKDVDTLKNAAQQLNGAGSIEFKPDERTIVDKGETVQENVHTNVQNIVVPVVDKDVHEYHSEKTIIPVHKTVNEAPVVQKKTLPPMSRDDFIKSGGEVDSSKTSIEDRVDLPQQGGRSEDGPASGLVKDLNLSDSTSAA